MATISPSNDPLLSALHQGLPSVLPAFLSKQRWFGGKARTVVSVTVSDIFVFRLNPLCAYLVMARVEYASGPAGTYAIPLIQTSQAKSLLSLPTQDSREEIFLSDALTDDQFLDNLLSTIEAGATLPGTKGEIRAVGTSALGPLMGPGRLRPSLMHAEQSNSSVVYGNRLVLKIFRRLEQGLNPDLEIGSFLTQKTSFQNVPPLAGYLEYRDVHGASSSLGILQGYIANQGDAWQFTLQCLANYYAEVPAPESLALEEETRGSLLEQSQHEIPDSARQRIGSYLESAGLLGRRTAELHVALASDAEDRDFKPEALSEQSMRFSIDSATQLLEANFGLLQRMKNEMPAHVQDEAAAVLALQEQARHRLQLSARLKNSAVVTRIHGDYHLGQVLFTGDDFVIIDFEGEPARPLEERRRKRSPLQDVAGMLRSFHYAAYAPLLQQADAAQAPHGQIQRFGSWARFWQRWVSTAFLKSYFEVANQSIFIPRDQDDLARLLDFYLLDKAIYELGYELNNRPSWVRIPLDGISQLLQPSV
jgi:maltose alpha-D-glucosyltransferase/alpha-amylase